MFEIMNMRASKESFKSQDNSFDLQFDRINRRQKVNNIRFTILDDLDQLNENINGTIDNEHQSNQSNHKNYATQSNNQDATLTIKNNYQSVSSLSSNSKKQDINHSINLKQKKTIQKHRLTKTQQDLRNHMIEPTSPNSYIDKMSMLKNVSNKMAPKSPINSLKTKDPQDNIIGQEIQTIERNKVGKIAKASFKKPRMYLVQKIIDLTKQPDVKYLKEIESTYMQNNGRYNVRADWEYQKQNKEYNLFSKAIQTERNKGKKFSRIKK